MNVVHEHWKYTIGTRSVPEEVMKSLKIDWEIMKYEPIIWLSDFWMLKKDMVCMNETLDGSHLNLTLNFKVFSTYFF